MNTFNKIIIAATLSFGILLINTQAEAKSKISSQQAKEIAAKHANVPLREANFTEVSFDDDYNPEYEIEFYHNNIEYDYEIDAKSGKINSYSQEKHGKNHNKHNKHSTNYITEEDAKRIAFKHAKVSPTTSARVEFDMDDGLAVYEIKFVVNGSKYKYEINAINSEIVEFEKD